MAGLYPFVLQPIFKERVWGGAGLTRFYGSDLPPGSIGEAWVLGEHHEGTSIIINGPFAGESLTHLRRDYGSELLGTRGVTSLGGRCPLLIKLLDAQDDLSVQVHPADEYAGLPPGEPGKTEMWYVLAAEPGAEIVYGLREGTDHSALAAAARGDYVEQCLQRIPVSPGDVFFVPAGTVHALGKGMIVAEIQQSSDTTYRLFDYRRPGLDGRPRPLHVEEALMVTQYSTPRGPIRPRPVPNDHWQHLVTSPYFVVHRAQVTHARLQETTSTSFDALLVCAGQGEIAWNGGRETLRMGQAVLVPASLGMYELTGQMEVLRVRVP